VPRAPRRLAFGVWRLAAVSACLCALLSSVCCLLPAACACAALSAPVLTVQRSQPVSSCQADGDGTSRCRCPVCGVLASPHPVYRVAFFCLISLVVIINIHHTVFVLLRRAVVVVVVVVVLCVVFLLYILLFLGGSIRTLHSYQDPRRSSNSSAPDHSGGETSANSAGGDGFSGGCERAQRARLGKGRGVKSRQQPSRCELKCKGIRE
jgi:uncharacterized membrane protein YgcG